jgi:hypothetical protein
MPNFHDKIIINDDLQKAYDELENFIFGYEEEMAAREGNANATVVNDINAAGSAIDGEIEGQVNGLPSKTIATDAPATSGGET